MHDHLTSRTPPPPPAGDKDKPTAPADSWERLDAIVLQWIYGTISNDLLHTIFKPVMTAHDVWTALANIFQDHKTSRGLFLENKFSNTCLDNFTDVSAYCQELKILANQLSNVDSKIDNIRLVLQLIAGLNEQYKGIATLMQHTKPLPDFYVA